MELKKINSDIFILGDRIDILKEYMTDGEYMEAMDSLSKLKNGFDCVKEFMGNVEEFMAINHNFNYDIETSPFSSYMNSVNNYIILRSKIRIILTNKLHKFRIDNNLPLDFMKSKFNLIDFICDLDYNILKKNYIIENNIIRCSCDNDNKISFCCDSLNNFLHCGKLQETILRYPLLLSISYDRPLDELIKDIVKYNMFIFDGSIKDMDNIIITNIEVTNIDKNKYFSNVYSLLTLFEKINCNVIRKIRHIKKIFIVLTIYKLICYNGIFIKKYPKFYKTSYNKLNEFKRDGMRVFYYCFTKLKLDRKLFDIIENNLDQYIGSYPEIMLE